MWHSMFVEQIPFAEKILRTIIVYALIALLFRLTGKRGLAGLRTFDFARAPGGAAARHSPPDPGRGQCVRSAARGARGRPWVDGLHASSMLMLATVGRRERRAALADALAEALFAAAGVSAAGVSAARVPGCVPRR